MTNNIVKIWIYDIYLVTLQVTVEPNTNGSVTLLSDERKHFPIINIKIRQCYQVLCAVFVLLVATTDFVIVTP